jgi:uncharacterized protein YecE (DUF72 family)
VAVHVGTSGWSYDHWDGVLYPPGTPSRDRLAHYVRRFGTVELNASFYRWPRTATFAGWRQRLPEGFRLSVKAPRGLTHAKRLYAPETWVERIAAAWHELGPRRAVLLVQLHPAAARDDARLDHFLTVLPDWVRVAVEFRHPSWHDEAVFALLERHGAAYCVMSGAGLPSPRTCTPAPTPTPTCAGGPTGSRSGRRRGATSTRTSTTTATATPSGTPRPSGAWSAAERGRPGNARLGRSPPTAAGRCRGRRA